MIFNYEWWFDTAYQERVNEARLRCTGNHFPDMDPAKVAEHPEAAAFMEQLETRTIVYLRDGFSYEIKDVVPSRSTTVLTFECAPTDEAYKVGAFIVTVPFDEILRVEVFAYHPKEKPEDMPAIKGFSAAQASVGPPKRTDERSPRREAQE